MSLGSTEDRIALGERLQASLVRAHVTPAAVADELGLSESTVRAWLEGSASPRLVHLMAWARICDEPFEALAAGEPPDP